MSNLFDDLDEHLRKQDRQREKSEARSRRGLEEAKIVERRGRERRRALEKARQVSARQCGPMVNHVLDLFGETVWGKRKNLLNKGYKVFGGIDGYQHKGRIFKVGYRSTFRNAWFQIYQRGEDSVRFETHMFPNLHLEEAMMILRQLVEIRSTSLESEYRKDEGADSSFMFQ